MYLTADSALQLLHEKRNKFQVEIRRKRTENTFQQKRAIFVQNKDLELLAQYALEFYNRGDLQECENYLIRLNEYADSQYSANLKSINTITFLGEIATNCDYHILAIVLSIYQKIYLPECLNPYLLSQIQRFENSELIKQFVVLLHKIVKNNPLNHLVEQCDFVSYLVEISLLLDNFEQWFKIVEVLGSYIKQPSYYFKKLVVTCIKFIEYDTDLATFQIMLTMISCEKDNKNSINYLLANAGFVDLIMDKLDKNMMLSISIISKIVEESDEGTILFIQHGLLKTLSNLYFEMRENQTAFIYITANICFLKNDYVITEVLTSEIFNTILALDEQELNKNDYIYISQMLQQLIRKYSNEQLYRYLLNKTDYVYMLGHMMKQFELREVLQNAISCVIHMAHSQSEELAKLFRYKISGKPIEYVLTNIQYLFQDINIIEQVFEFLNIKYD
ncbi:unnamed protein product [Paramecium pentaurelia]|uniref:Uncharacterized protein n=1 Tax=Paramecium pentaurelia TaxID=43138 RepID=A0A8S1XZI4_9CILI|nr:unnamed protein product [Paramecium pentaurelia]